MNHGKTLAFGALVALLALPAWDTAQSQPEFFVALDSSGTARELSDTTGLCTIYIVEGGTSAGGGFLNSRFMVDNGAFTGVWLADMSGFETTGSSQTGIYINYGQCIEPPIVALAVMYYRTGTSPCTTVSLVPDPADPQGLIESYDCVYARGWLFPGVRVLCVNGTLVDRNGPNYCDCTVPVEKTTWGKIKGMYR